MPLWSDDSGNNFSQGTDPALWSPTKQSFAARLNQNINFHKWIKTDFVRGDSDPQVSQSNNGGFIIQVVGSTPSGSSGYYRSLANAGDYGGMLVRYGFLNRFITVMGSCIFLATPSNALPGAQAKAC